MGGPHEKKMNGKKKWHSHIEKIKLHYKLFNNYINYH